MTLPQSIATRTQTKRPIFNRSAALLLLLTLTHAVGSDAVAGPFTRSASSIAKANHEALTTGYGYCATTTKSSNVDLECLVPRGGSTAAVAATASATSASEQAIFNTESLKMVGVTTVFMNYRNAALARTQEWWRTAQTAKFLLAGAVAGIVSRTAVSPLEVVATAQMVRGGNKNLIGELTQIFQAEGCKGFFKGNGANCLKVAPTRGVQFFAFEKFKGMLVDYKRKSMGLEDDANVVLNPIERLVAGGFAGMIASSMVYPIEVVKTMLTMYPGKYAGIGGAFRGVIQEVGPKGLYAGLGPTLIAMFPYVGVEFMIYETSKLAIETFLSDRSGTDESGQPIAVALPIIISLGLGALAGAAAQSSAHPLDVIRKRLQVQGINGNPVLYKNTIDCLTGIATKEGAGALYKGLGPACVATIPGTGIAYITYEIMKKFLQLSSV